MKILNILMISSLILLLSSCYKDQSNYNLTEGEIISVSEIDTAYNVVVSMDSLIIRPEVSSNMDADFEYFWGLYEKNISAGAAEPFDTISKSKDLEVMIAKDAKEWVLVFSAKNKRTGYSVFKTSALHVTTEFSRGWYVLKDDGVNADVDLHTSKTSIIPSSFSENLYSQLNGRKLSGKGVNINFHHQFRGGARDAGGSLELNRAFYFISEKDIAIVKVNDFKDLRNFATAFIVPPRGVSLAGAFNTRNGSVIVSNSKIHEMDVAAWSPSYFGLDALEDKGNDYEASPYILTTTVSEPYFFDNKTSRFKYFDTRNSDVIIDGNFANETANMKALYMGVRTLRNPSAGALRQSVGVFQDKTNPSVKKILTFNTNNAQSPIYSPPSRVNSSAISATSKLYNATLYTVNYANEELLYFVVNGNELWSCNLNGSAEKLQYTAPVGETITYIRHKEYIAETSFSFNYVMVGTESSGRYKLHMFNKSAGNLAASPEFTLQGKGTVRDVIYLSPSVTSGTFVSAR